MNKLEQKLGQLLLPMVTPFYRDTQEVNYDMAAKLTDHLIKEGYADSLIVAGTTGEFNTLMYDERVELMRVVKEAAAGRIPLIAGTGAASTKEAIMLTKEAEKLGYDAAMVVAPYYCKPTQDAIYNHFKKVAESVEMDIILYNIPIFTGVNMEPETVKRLHKIKNIVGIKDEAGINPTQITEFRRATDDDFTIYNGDDIMVLCGMIQGAAGIVSGGSHIIGKEMREMLDAFRAGDIAKATHLHHMLDPFFKGFCPNGRINGIPAMRACIEMLGLPVGPARMPLDECTNEEKAVLRDWLKHFGKI